jgi:uncharacterized SAM-binding protein YcdF (DUF218 family)
MVKFTLANLGTRILSALKVFLMWLGALALLVCLTPVTIWYARLLAGDWPAPEGEVLIVLAGSDYDSGIMGESTYLRCVYAVKIWREQRFPQVVISGGKTAADMRDYLVFHGVPAQIIRLESRSKSTRENALFTRELLQAEAGRKVLLTSDYHMFRAVRAFRRAGVNVVPCPFPDAIKRAQTLMGRLPAFFSEAVETVKIAGYFARGWI